MKKQDLIKFAKKWMKSKVVYCSICDKGFVIVYPDKYSNSWHSLYGNVYWNGLNPCISGCKHKPHYYLFINGKKEV